MGITGAATVRRDVAHLWELAVTHIVHTGRLHDAVRSVVLFILAVSFMRHAHGIGSNSWVTS